MTTPTTRSRKPAKPTEIASAVIYRCTDKQTHETFYLVQSDTHADVFYAVRWDDARACWLCPCESRKPCKHIRAIQEVQIAKREPDVEREVALPVAVRDFEGYTAHLDCGDHREVVRAHDLPSLFPNGYRLVENDDPERDAWDKRMSELEDRTCGGVADAAWIAQVRTALPERASDIVTDDDMAAHIEDSIRSGEFADPTSCRYCGALCKGGVCMDCLDIAA